MKKFLLTFAIISVALLTTNCKKDVSPPDQSAATADVQFNLSSVTQQGGLKSTASDIICTTLPNGDLVKADYVKYTIGGVEKRIDVFYVGNVAWTNAIKMPVGTYTISEFLVYSDNNTPANTGDDILLSAVPHAGSTYAGYVTTPLNQTFSVVLDKKTEVKLDVVCFQPMTFQNFGFVYFTMNELVVRQLWFFGDFCIKDKTQYTGSLYAQQTNWNSVAGPFIDVPAIAKVEVWRGNPLALQNTFTNSAQGEKFSVTYGDYKNQVDPFVLKLFILVRTGTSFDYILFKTWQFNDISNIDQGTDGVVDYVLGNCYDPANPPNLVLAPWMNLPLTATYKITAFPGTLGGYVDATLSNITTGYDISNGVYASNCADHATNITVGVPYTMNVYSSLYPDKLPAAMQATSGEWEKINWLYNHLDWYPGYHWYDIQGFIWLYDSPAWDGLPVAGMPGLTPMSTQMKVDANNYGVGYKVPPGGWAAIIFYGTGSTPIQTMFIKIDP